MFMKSQHRFFIFIPSLLVKHSLREKEYFNTREEELYQKNQTMKHFLFHTSELELNENLLQLIKRKQSSDSRGAQQWTRKLPGIRETELPHRNDGALREDVRDLCGRERKWVNVKTFPASQFCDGLKFEAMLFKNYWWLSVTLTVLRDATVR